MLQDSDQGSSDPGPVHLEAGSYTYGSSVGYQTQHETNGLPFFFWRETFGFCKDTDHSVTKEIVRYTESYARQQNIIWTRAVARYNNRLVFVGVLAALVSGLQWFEIHSGSTDTHALAEAAKAQATAAQNAAVTANDNLIASQRAWLGPVNATLSQVPVAGQGLKGTIVYQNSGKQPANISVVPNFEIFNSTDWDGYLGANYLISQQSSCKSNLDYTLGGVAFPITPSFVAGQYTINFNTSPEISNVGKLTATDELVRGINLFIITGCITYNTFGRVRHSFFCYFYRSKITTNIGALAICPKTGYAD